MLDILPFDVWVEICSYLSPFDLVHLNRIKCLDVKFDREMWKIYFGRLGFKLPATDDYKDAGWWLERQFPCEKCWNLSSGKLCRRHLAHSKYFQRKADIQSIRRWVIECDYELEECLFHVEGRMVILSERYGGALKRFAPNTAKAGFLFDCIHCGKRRRLRQCVSLACKKCCKIPSCSEHNISKQYQ